MAERPKRRKYRDNPYTLEYCEAKDTYKITFKDSEGIHQSIAVDSSVYNAFDKFELDDLSELNEFDNHTEHSEVHEITLNNKAVDKPISLEEEVETNLLNEELKIYIDSLSEVQKSRIKMYYFEDMTLDEIAEIQSTSHQAISKSIKNAIEQIKRNFKN